MTSRCGIWICKWQPVPFTAWSGQYFAIYYAVSPPSGDIFEGCSPFLFWSCELSIMSQLQDRRLHTALEPPPKLQSSVHRPGNPSFPSTTARTIHSAPTPRTCSVHQERYRMRWRVSFTPLSPYPQCPTGQKVRLTPEEIRISCFRQPVTIPTELSRLCLPHGEH
jgi:hypothetical protein